MLQKIMRTTDHSAGRWGQYSNVKEFQRLEGLRESTKDISDPKELYAMRGRHGHTRDAGIYDNCEYYERKRVEDHPAAAY